MDEEIRNTEEARAIEAAGRCAGLTKAEIDQQLDKLHLEAEEAVRKREDMEHRREHLVAKSQGDRGRLAAKVNEMVTKGEL